MKQKIVIKVSMKEPTSTYCCFYPQSSHSKALRLAGGFPGVQSVALVGDRDKIEVTGELDAVELTTLLRNKVGCAEIVSVGEVKPVEKKEDAKPLQWPYPRREVVYIHPEPGWW